MKTLKSYLTFVLFIAILSILSCSDDSGEPTLETPVAAFTVSNTAIEVGESVQFTSTSEGTITSYNWVFEGGIPAASSEPNPEVVYNTPGAYDVQLTVANSNGSDIEIADEYISVDCTACSQQCPELCTEQLIEDQTISVGGVERGYDVFLPSEHDIMEDLPVIINLHGTTGTKSLERFLTEFEPIAEENKIVMVLPQGSVLPTCNIGSQTRWNGNLFDTPDDIQFISDLIDQTIEDYNVDSERIYVMGRSNGGFMAYTLACELSEKIAAVASVAGAMTYNNMNNFCNSARVVPVLEIHGTADQVNSYNGFNNCEGNYAGVDDIIDFWRNKAGCSSEFDEFQYPDIDTSDNCTARRLTYQDCNNMVQLIIIDNGGHSYPGSSSFESYYQDFSNILWPINFDIEASQEIWSFLKDFSL
ncbi:PKD domain-containing protein [Psychroserpens sp.]|uniref:PKD domain-containing protein n=1 Tax=Psychroserpens sp. TaxID=2020870 RepID=UPI00385E1DA8